MKYHGFDSPLDWSQYLIQKADLHEYEPSEPGKRFLLLTLFFEH